MRKEVNTEQGELLNTQNNVSETHNENSPLIIHEPIENTPFIITGSSNKGYFIRMGSYRLTKYVKSIEECKTMLDSNKWEIIVTIIAAVEHANGNQNVNLE